MRIKDQYIKSALRKREPIRNQRYGKTRLEAFPGIEIDPKILLD